MKKLNLLSCASALVLAAGIVAATFPATGQSILININEANPSAVQFAATVNHAAVNDANHYNLFGVDLINYFTATASTGGSVTGNLIPAGTTVPYTQWFPDNLNAASAVDLNLYVTSNPQLQNFSTANRAFAGTAIIDLSAWLADLPHTGASGFVIVGSAQSSGWTIGRWTVVPEPPVEAQLTLGALVLAGLAFVRRARRAAASR